MGISKARFFDYFDKNTEGGMLYRTLKEPTSQKLNIVFYKVKTSFYKK